MDRDSLLYCSSECGLCCWGDLVGTQGIASLA